MTLQKLVSGLRARGAHGSDPPVNCRSEPPPSSLRGRTRIPTIGQQRRQAQRRPPRQIALADGLRGVAGNTPVLTHLTSSALSRRPYPRSNTFCPGS